MSHQGRHFPTFSRAYRAGSRLAMPARVITAPGLARLKRLERTLLRLALYLLLAVSGLQYLVIRWAAYFGGGRRWEMSPLNAGYRGYPQPYNIPGGYLASALIMLSSFFIPPGFELLIAVLCLVGLAASARHITFEVPEPDPRPAPVPKLPEPPQVPPTPQRHPLDPSPDDPPLVDYPWVHPRSKSAGL